MKTFFRNRVSNGNENAKTLKFFETAMLETRPITTMPVLAGAPLEPEVQNAGVAQPLHHKGRGCKAHHARRRLRVSRRSLGRRQLQRRPRGSAAAGGAGGRQQRGEGGIDLDGVPQGRPGPVQLQRAHLRPARRARPRTLQTTIVQF